VAAPKKLWTPSAERAAATAMHRFLEAARGAHPDVALADYNALHTWSVQQPADFWSLALAFLELEVEGSVQPVVDHQHMPEARYFPELRLNFADNLLRHSRPNAERAGATALLSVSETRGVRRVSYAELRKRVAEFAAGLRAAGINAGDRVAGFIPNIDEAVVAMLATTSLGAIWSSCSPDFGPQGVLDRFGQIEPRLLVAANGYAYGGKRFDCLEKLRGIAESIDAIERIVLVPYLEDHPTTFGGARAKCLVSWDAFVDASATEISFPMQPFNYALYVMYSSGTTGIPKCIVHGVGGTLLQHAKELILHCDLRPTDNIFYFTTCGWMMWNWLVSSLFVGATVTLFDGAPTYPGIDRLWRLLADEGITHFGTSPKFIGACRGTLRPRDTFDLSRLRAVISTGAPLLAEDFEWIYDAVGSELQLSSISGGTDIISCFMLGNPLLPVYRDEIQCLGLGMDVAAYDDRGQPVIGEKGELVCRTAFPSSPIYFWNDDSGDKYRQAYFKGEPGVWFHGDYIEITGSQGSAGGVVVYGRSDATLNPGGVRIGTAEIYRLVETMTEIDDSIVVGQPFEGDIRVVLFVKLAGDIAWDETLEKKIRQSIREGATPRHVPAVIRAVDAIPYTISGKKVELAVQQVLAGDEPKNKTALADPAALDCYRELDL